MRHFMLILTLLMGSALFGDQSQTLNQWEQNNFLQTLQQELQKQQGIVNDLKNQIARKDIILPGAINNQFENAVIMLNVKQTLYNNFVGTPSIQSPLVQAKLLELFRKDLITADDLAALEALVKQERPKYINKPATVTPQ